MSEPEVGTPEWFRALSQKEFGTAYKRLEEEFERAAERREEEKAAQAKKTSSPMYESMMQIMRMFNGPELTVACHPLDFELINEAVESQVNAGHTRKLVEVTKSDFVRPGQVIVINNRKMNEPIRSRITQLPRIFLDNLPDE